MTEALDYLLRLLEGREKDAKVIRAVVGDGTGNIAVEGMTQHIWIRPYNRDYPVAAFAPQGGVYPEGTIVRAKVVHVGGKAFYVIGEPDHEAYGHGATPSGLGNVPAHGGQHQWGTGGFDPVFVHPSQFTPLLMYPTSPMTMKVYISPGYWRHGGLLKYWPGGESADLSAYLPATDFAHYLLLYFDASTMQLQYRESEPFAASIAIPSAYSYPIPAPPNSVVVGYVLLKHDSTYIDTGMTFPFRSILNVEHGTETAQSWLLAACEDSLWQSVGGYLWTQLGDTDPYLTQGIHHVVVVDEDRWLVFRQQATAVAGDPIVYKTSNRGVSWAKAQNGMTFVQGSDLWCSYTVTQNPRNKEQIAVVIMPISGTRTPEVYITTDGGALWTQVSGTGLPSFAVSAMLWPMSVAVQDWTMSTLHISVAFGQGGLYRKYSTGSWTIQAILSTEAIWAIHADFRSSVNWVAAGEFSVHFTQDSWTTKNTYWLAYDDYPSPYIHTIYQHPTDLLRFVIGGSTGVHTTLNAATFMRDTSMEIGLTGRVLTSLTGLPTLVFVARENDGALFSSPDGCMYLMQGLSLYDVVSLAGIHGDPSALSGGAATELSWHEIWLKG